MVADYPFGISITRSDNKMMLNFLHIIGLPYFSTIIQGFHICSCDEGELTCDLEMKPFSHVALSEVSGPHDTMVGYSVLSVLSIASITPSTSPLCGDVQIFTTSKPTDSTSSTHCRRVRAIPANMDIMLMSPAAKKDGQSLFGKTDSLSRIFE